ncbi:MAG: hypothetical protein WCD69_08010, partial [Xanthobacteraceae bacterium]
MPLSSIFSNRRAGPRWKIFRKLYRLAQRHSTKHSNAKNIKPSIVEIEQVRVGYRRDNIFAHCHQTQPRDRTFAAEQGEVRKPHRPQHDRAKEPKLNGDRKSLIVRID